MAVPNSNSNGHAHGDSVNGKRKRDDRDDRKAAPKERRMRQRQEEMEEEFAATYHGPTALYKMLEVHHRKGPLFLPRTLSYRCVPPPQKKMRTSGEDSKPREIVKTKTTTKTEATVKEMTGATLHDFKIGMTQDDVNLFKAEGVRLGVQFALYTSTDTTTFADNSFELLATCLTTLPCSKTVQLPAQFVRSAAAQLSVVVVQVVRVNDVIQQLTTETQYTFAAPPSDSATEIKPVRGADLLATSVASREPLSSNMLRLGGTRRRAGVVHVTLPPVGKTDKRGVMQVAFKVQWDPLSKTNQMERLEKIAVSKWPSDYVDTKDDVSSQLTVPKREKTKVSPFTRRGNTHVWFHYLYHSMLRRMSEKRHDFSCVWCNLYAGSLSGLISHLISSHSRFRFHVSAGNDNVPHIYVVPRNQKGSANVPNVNPARCEINLDDDKDADRIEQHFTFISTRKRLGAAKAALLPALDGPDNSRIPELDELDELAEEQPQEFYAPLLQRQYFHSRTGAVVLDHEKGYDSDDDVDEEWITQQSERLLDEFEDVSLEEKEFMKKWNRHVKEQRILADFMVASSCRLFAKRHGKWLNASGLRFNFLLHLFNLWDNSLLTARAIIDCMLIVDHYAVLQEIKDADANGTIANGTAAGTTAALPAPSSA